MNGKNQDVWVASRSYCPAAQNFIASYQQLVKGPTGGLRYSSSHRPIQRLLYLKCAQPSIPRRLPGCMVHRPQFQNLCHESASSILRLEGAIPFSQRAGPYTRNSTYATIITHSAATAIEIMPSVDIVYSDSGTWWALYHCESGAVAILTMICDMSLF